MKFLFKAKDGGEFSTVTGYWLVESKKLISICVLKFEGKSREAFHTHAFNCISIVLKGQLFETMITGENRIFKPFKPFITKRTDFHKVDGDGISWIITIRGPWKDTWEEFIPSIDKFLKLTNGRKVIEE